MSKGPYSMTTPCDNCPFRSDVDPYLRHDRVREIERGLERGEFPCHKTTKYNDEGETVESKNGIHCAGALILMMKEDRSSQMMRIAYRLGMFDPVYDSFDEMEEAMRNSVKNLRKM